MTNPLPQRTGPVPRRPAGFKSGFALLLGGALLALASCAPNPTPYTPAMANNGYGYGDQQIEQNRFRVTFNGNSDTPRQVVETYLLYRAAQITKAQGFDYFILADKDTEANTRYRSTFDDFHAFGGYHPYYPHGWGYGGGIGYSDSYPITRYQSYADIVMMKGRKPANDFRAFSADEVLGRLGGTIMAPPQPPR